MTNKNLKSNQILEKKFKTEISGYSAREVDEYLDLILEDYRKFEEEVELHKRHIEDRDILLKEREETIEALKLELENTHELLKQVKATKNIDIAEQLKTIQRELNYIKSKDQRK